MSVSGLHREMIQNQCFVQVGPDRIEKILSSSQYEALREKWSIVLDRTETQSQDNSSMDSLSLTEDNQRRLPKKRLLQSFHDESASASCSEQKGRLDIET